MHISYYLHESGNYHVVLRQMGQVVSVSPGLVRRLLGIQNVIVGCRSIDTKTAEELGFVLPAGMMIAAV